MICLNDTNINLRDFAGISPSATKQQREDFMTNLETAIRGWMPDNQKVCIIIYKLIKHVIRAVSDITNEIPPSQALGHVI